MRLPSKWLAAATHETFDLVAEDDFNPDGVLCMAYDLYEAGFSHGLIAAGIGASVILAGCVIGHLRSKKNEE